MPAALQMSHYVVVSNMPYSMFVIGMRHLMKPNENSLPPPQSGFPLALFLRIQCTQTWFHIYIASEAIEN